MFLGSYHLQDADLTSLAAGISLFIPEGTVIRLCGYKTKPSRGAFPLHCWPLHLEVVCIIVKGVAGAGGGGGGAVGSGNHFDFAKFISKVDCQITLT